MGIALKMTVKRLCINQWDVRALQVTLKWRKRAARSSRQNKSRLQGRQKRPRWLRLLKGIEKKSSRAWNGGRYDVWTEWRVEWKHSGDKGSCVRTIKKKVLVKKIYVSSSSPTGTQYVSTRDEETNEKIKSGGKRMAGTGRGWIPLLYFWLLHLRMWQIY